MDETAVRPEAPILLLTKLHPPFVPEQTVARERLFALLRERRPLTLVADDDDVVLWSHVIEALCRACPALDHPSLSAPAMTAPVREVVLPRLVNALAEVGD